MIPGLRVWAFGLAMFACAWPAPAGAGPHVDYLVHCQGCHRADGSGAPGAVPALSNSVGKFLEVPRGREYLVRVPGSSMSPLSDADLAAVLNWMIRQFGPAEIAARFKPFTAEEVAGVRSPPLDEVQAMRRELVEAMH